ncbi:MAG: ABC transporter ATP-binding protein [Saccharolobus sp.]|uniref:ABC transporter ATP-binding protein n=1 Tax=Saccharolobus sp. TaxID=2100761 RepID=UPI00317A7C29
MEVLNIINVTKRFGEFIAVDSVSFSIEEGKGPIAIIGPNGAGKTTLINVITKKLNPDKGRIFFYGKEITKLKPEHITKLGLVRTFQNVNIYPSLTVEENIMLTSLFSKSLKTKAYDIIEMLGLTPYRNRKAGALPFGVQKLIELGIALALKPKTLILDEPAAGLTYEERKRLVGILKDIGETIPLIIVEHDMDVVFNLANEIIVMNKGKIIATGKTSEIANNKVVREIYLGEEYA